jgi:hypothetical protein
LSVRGYTWARFQDVRISGAEGEPAVAVDTPFCWLENVSADGTLQTPGGSTIQAYESAILEGEPTSTFRQSRLVENCHWFESVGAGKAAR